jgi:MFS family permease
MTVSEFDLLAADQTEPASIPGKWRTLILLSLAELLAMSVWFSASAVIPVLTETWGLSGGGQAWLTMSVQVGFVVGALGAALFNLADRLPSRWLFAGSSLMAGLTTALVAVWASDLNSAVILRFLTGVFLAGVYPVGMKIMATWTKKDRGLGIGLLVGALTFGSATPHLLNAFGGISGDWRQVLYLAGGSAVLGAIIGALFASEGPYKASGARFDWLHVGRLVTDRESILANLGYLGHMWELYAMWAWIPVFLLASFAERGLNPTWASLVAFAVIAVGGLGSFVAGPLADRFGRTTITTLSLVISGAAAVSIGLLFGSNPVILTVVALIWGFSVVADSAQYSAAISELSEPKYVGTALTLQTSLGFMLTLFTIRLIPPIQRLVGWQFAFALLALGPLVGIWAMQTLRRSPRANQLAGGRG